MTSPTHDQLAAIELLGIDIDGTMLRTDGVMTDRTKAALHAARDVGLHVVPTTGRPYIVSLDVIELLDLNEHWIFANGAITRHLGREETVRAYWMEIETAAGLVRTMRERLDNIRFAVEFEIDVAYEHGFEKIVPSQPPGDPVDDVIPAIIERVQKVLVFDAARPHSFDALDELYETTVAVLDGQGVASYSGLSFIEVAAKSVTKATALELLAGDFGLSQSQVATFGDNHNDVPMLEWAGSSFAMGNATDDAKEAANYTIGHTDEDGLAVLIEQILDAKRA